MAVQSVMKGDYIILGGGHGMPEQQQDFILKELTEIRKRYSEEHWPQMLQKIVNEKYPPAGWNCIIGRDFSAEFFNTNGCLLIFGINQTHRGVIFRLF